MPFVQTTYVPFDGSAPAATVGQVLNYANRAAFPAAGVANKLYVDTSNHAMFVWNGTAYVPAVRVGPRVQSIASSATPAINTDLVDFVTITALAVNITGFTFTGTPADGQRLNLRIKDTGSARTIAWGALCENGSVALPATTTAGKTLAVTLVWDAADTKWACEAAASRA